MIKRFGTTVGGKPLIGKDVASAMVDAHTQCPHDAAKVKTECRICIPLTELEQAVHETLGETLEW